MNITWLALQDHNQSFKISSEKMCYKYMYTFCVYSSIEELQISILMLHSVRIERRVKVFLLFENFRQVIRMIIVFQSWLKRTLNKQESCISWTINKVPM
jgi:hypothetical protein